MSLLLNMKKLEKCFIVLSHTFQTQYLPKIFKRIKRQTKPSHYLGFFSLLNRMEKGSQSRFWIITICNILISQRIATPDFIIFSQFFPSFAGNLLREVKLNLFSWQIVDKAMIQLHSLTPQLPNPLLCPTQLWWQPNFFSVMGETSGWKKDRTKDMFSLVNIV